MASTFVLALSWVLSATGWLAVLTTAVTADRRQAVHGFLTGLQLLIILRYSAYSLNPVWYSSAWAGKRLSLSLSIYLLLFSFSISDDHVYYYFTFTLLYSLTLFI